MLSECSVLCSWMCAMASSSASTTFTPRINAIHSVSKSSGPAGTTCARARALQDGKRVGCGAQLDLAGRQPLGHRGQELPRHRPVHQHGVQRVADAGPLHLGVLHDVDGAGQVGALVHEDVADAHAAGDHRDRRLLAAEPVQGRAAARDDHVHVLVQPQQLRHQRPVGVGDRLHRGRRDAGARPARPGSLA